MNEKKTFKITGASDGQLIHEVDDDWYACCGHVFDMDEWDMEVTFTKKPKTPEVGGKALSPSGAYMCEIAAIDGDEVWLRYPDGSHNTIDLDQLIYAS